MTDLSSKDNDDAMTDMAGELIQAKMDAATAKRQCVI